MWRHPCHRATAYQTKPSNTYQQINTYLYPLNRYAQPTQPKEDNMKVKELIEALQGVDPEKEVSVVGTYDTYEITGIYVGEVGIDIELERSVWA